MKSTIDFVYIVLVLSLVLIIFDFLFFRFRKQKYDSGKPLIDWIQAGLGYLGAFVNRFKLRLPRPQLFKPGISKPSLGSPVVPSTNSAVAPPIRSAIVPPINSAVIPLVENRPASIEKTAYIQVDADVPAGLTVRVTIQAVHGNVQPTGAVIFENKPVHK